MKIESYKLRLYGGPAGAGPPSYSGVRAEVRLYGRGGNDHQTITFHEEGHEMPAEDDNGPMRLPWSAWRATVYLLRHETGAVLTWNPVNGWMLETGDAPR